MFISFGRLSLIMGISKDPYYSGFNPIATDDNDDELLLWYGWLTKVV